MKETFIKKIIVKDYKVLKKNEFELKSENLIITGKNGSGKTVLLEAINTFLGSLLLKDYENVINLDNDIRECKKKLYFLRDEEILTEASKSEINKLKNRLEFFNLKEDKFCKGVRLQLKGDGELQKRFDLGEFIFLYYKSRRNIEIDDALFKEYLLQLKDREEEAIAIDDEEELVLIKRWFNMIERLFKSIFMTKDLEFSYNDELEDYAIHMKNKAPLRLNELSDGHTAALKFFIEIMSKMEKIRTNKYDVEGIILIDEIERHIHPSLQSKMIYLLKETFPNIQFIITTMSKEIIENSYNSFIYNLDK
ncbi:MAG: AAA family ATPase [Clostridium sp.]|uniref:AAA family ATPase n=1 Tax=Clostridium sp. TaxID=1506 RepID=UPI003F2E624D